MEGGESGDRQEEWEGEREGIDRSGVGGGESGDRQEWGGRGESGDRQEWGGRGREWG